jgi:hypothetical protein
MAARRWREKVGGTKWGEREESSSWVWFGGKANGGRSGKRVNGGEKGWTRPKGETWTKATPQLGDKFFNCFLFLFFSCW